MRMKKLLLITAIVATMTVSTSAIGSYHSFEEDSITAINAGPALKSVSGGIEIAINDEAKHDFYIYSITGQMVKSITLSETTVVDLPQGCYIVKCESWSKKIVVR